MKFLVQRPGCLLHRRRADEGDSTLIQLNDLGTVAALAAAFLLFYRFRSLPHAAPVPRQTFLGAAILFVGFFLTGLGIPAVALYFTPIAWTGYLIWIDGAIYSLRGESLLRNHRSEFLWLALCSIPLWLIFEAYNLRLANWIYIGLPENLWLRLFGYAWAFATIWPGIFETAALLRALDWNILEADITAAPVRSPRRAWLWASLIIGLLLVTVPLLLPPEMGSYLFGAVWLGFIFLLEPVNYWTGRESLWRDFARGDSSRLRALLGSGMLCGILWEFWNHFAAAQWFYTFPIFQDWKIFAMPLPGYLGFPAFAVECFALFALIAPWLDWLQRKIGGRRGSEWFLFRL